ncbi:nucleotide-diphospho-sugar transferase [Coniochaeta sp. 2T2.1]|nr:nucleotide-diphospho-sugar transferase [Coniochaeta sp. 2T2.1]
MRLRPKTVCIGLLALVPVLILLATVASKVLNFLHLFRNHSGIALTQQAALDAYNNNADIHNTTHATRPRQLVPKIIHQVFHNWKQPGNDTLPEDWQEVRQTCIDLNPDFEVKLWTELSSWDFIAREYPWFLDTYEGYRFPVQRVDAVRYFLMLHYGGIYIDLDNGCTANLSPLLYYPVWITDAGRGALSNNILAAQPNHPFWSLLVNRLYEYAYTYPFPYITISYASGAWFQTDVWEEYHALLPDESKTSGQENRLYRLMMDERVEEGADRWVFFSQHRGQTWVNWDNVLFNWVGEHIVIVMLGVLVMVGGSTWWCVRVLRGRRSWGYERIESVKDEELQEVESVR